jgi:hypothetical protein
MLVCVMLYTMMFVCMYGVLWYKGVGSATFMVVQRYRLVTV